MKRILILALIGIVAYAFFLLWYLPAPLALQWYGPLPNGMQLYGVRGTPIHGQADALIGPKSRLDHIDWQLAPGELFTGRLGYHLSFNNPNSSGHGIISRGLSGSISAAPLELRTDLKALSHRWDFAERFGGQLALQIRSLTIDDGRIIDAQGEVAWSGAYLRGDSPDPIGGFQARIEAGINTGNEQGNDGFGGPIGDNGGPLSVTGRLQLNPDGSWTLKGKLSLRDPTNTAAASLLASLGRPGSDGKTPFEWTGQLPPALLLPGPAPE